MIETQESPLAWRLRSPVDPKPTKPIKADPAPIVRPTLPNGFPINDANRCETDNGKARLAWVDANLPVTEHTTRAQCQCCYRELEANAGIVRDHAHKRRDGYNEGACMGSGSMPLQLDFNVLKDLIQRILPNDIKLYTDLVNHAIDDDIVFQPNGQTVSAKEYPEWVEVNIVRYYAGRRCYDVITPTAYAKAKREALSWDDYKAKVVTSWRNAIESLLAEIKERKARLAAWKPEAYLHL